MDTLVADHELDDTFPFVDNITICGCDNDGHDKNLKLVMEVAEKERLTCSEEITHHITPSNPTQLVLCQYLTFKCGRSKAFEESDRNISYYAKWINDFSDKIHVLNNVTKLPLNKTQKNVFTDMKLELANAAMQPIDENIPFVVATNASDFAVSATLNQY